MDREQLIKALASVPTDRTTFRRGNFVAQAHAGGSGETTILSYTADQPFTLENGQRYRMVPVARQSFTTNNTADDQETFNLDRNLIKSDVSDDLVLYEGGNQVQPDSVDYANNSVKYTDDGTDNELTVYYVSDAQAALKLKKVGPSGSVSETLVQHDAALVNRRDPNRDPLTFDLDASILQPVVPKNWSLEWTIEGPYNAGWDPDTDPAPVNLLVSVPVQQATVREVEGLSRLVRQDASERV